MNQLILSDFKESCGLEIISVCPVDGGWLNKKWKVSTGSGDYLVKQFSNKRYSGEKLQRVEAALLRQEEVNKMGAPCPSVKLWGGRAVRILDNDTAYMAMDFCPGKRPIRLQTNRCKALVMPAALCTRLSPGCLWILLRVFP